jgi:hypothetical protein
MGTTRGITAALAIAAFLIAGTARADHRPPEIIATVPVTGMDLAVDADDDRVYISMPTELTVLDGRTNTIAGSLVVRAQHEVIGESGDQVRGGTVPVVTGAVDVNPLTDRVYLASQHLYVIDGSALGVLTAIPGRGSGFYAVGVNSLTNTIYATFWSLDGVPSLAVIDGYTNRVTGVTPYGGTVVAVDENADRVYVQLGQDVFSLDGQGRLIAQRRFDPEDERDLVLSPDAHDGRLYVAYWGDFVPPSEGYCPWWTEIWWLDGANLNRGSWLHQGEDGQPLVVGVNPVAERLYLAADPPFYYCGESDSDGADSSSDNGSYTTYVLGTGTLDIEINPVTDRAYLLRGLGVVGSAVMVLEGSHPEE